MLFSSNIEEGVSAMVRSIDPFAHIECNFYFYVANMLVIQKLIRFVNEFWFFSFGKFYNLTDLLKENSNFITKIKMYNEPKEFLENLIAINKI